MIIDHSTKNKLIDFYYNDLSINDFEKWLYENDYLEKFDEQIYMLLIDINYKDKEEVNIGKRKLKDLYKIHYDVPIEIDKTRLILNKIITGELAIDNGCRILADLCANGNSFIPIVFEGYSSEIERLGNYSFYKDRIIKDAKKLLVELSSF